MSRSATATIRAAMRQVTRAWVFGAVWMYIVTGAAMTQYAKLLGVPEIGFGILAALPFAGALVQLPVSYVIERYGLRKLIFVGAGIVHRGLWLVAAWIPLVLPREWWWPALVLVVGASWAAGQMVGPCWVSWMADLVPARIRGRYFSRRTQIGQFVGLVVTLGVGYVLDWAYGETGTDHDLMLRVIGVVLGVAGLLGIVDFFHFLRVPEVKTSVPDPSVNLWGLIREPLLDRNFRRFLAYAGVLTFSLGYLGQFMWLYLFDVAKMSNTQANAMLVLGPLATLMVSFPLWGKVIDRMGRKPVLILAVLLNLPGTALWIFVSREHWLLPYALILLVTAAWPGVELANFNILLNLSGPTTGQRKSSGYVAVFSVVCAIAGVASGLFGGAVARSLRDWHTAILGWPLTYHGVLMLISVLLRLVSLAWIIRLEEPGAETTRAAFRYMGTNIYSNLQQIMFIPGRLLWQRARWTVVLDQLGPITPWRRRGKQRRRP